MNMRDAVHLATLAAILPALLFCITYMHVRWWKTALGRHLMSFMGAIVLVLTVAAVDQFLDYPYKGQISFAAMVIINAFLWMHWSLLIRIIMGKYPGPKCPNCGEPL